MDTFFPTFPHESEVYSYLYFPNTCLLYCVFCKTKLHSYTQTECAKCYLNVDEPGMAVFANELEDLPCLKKIQLSIKSIFAKSSICQKTCGK